jgi:protein gp37
MAKTAIQWTWRRILLPDGSSQQLPGYTFNPWLGCMKIVPECRYCYAEELTARWGRKVWGPSLTTERSITSIAYWKQPLTWNREAQAQGHRRSVFCASLADVFEDHPGVGQARTRLWGLIEQTPWLNWLLLTKRPENMVTMTPPSWANQWPDNAWAGTSAGTQAIANRNVPSLLRVPAVVRFVSCEPMLEAVDFRPRLGQVQWIICGGESGTQARPFNLDWPRDLRDQCLEYDVPYFFKQVGGRYHSSGGRDLDGRTWDDMPPEQPHLVTSAK